MFGQDSDHLSDPRALLLSLQPFDACAKFDCFESQHFTDTKFASVDLSTKTQNLSNSTEGVFASDSHYNDGCGGLTNANVCDKYMNDGENENGAGDQEQETDIDRQVKICLIPSALMVLWSAYSPCSLTVCASNPEFLSCT